MKSCDYGANVDTDTPGCGREAQFRAVIEARPFAGCKATEVEMPWFVCRRHRDAVTLNDVITGIGWQYIVDDHARNGRLKPVKEFTTIRFRRL